MKLRKSKLKVEPMGMRAAIEPSSFNEEERTVEVVFSTGSRVKRYSYEDGFFWEELSLKRNHVNLKRLKAGAPVLDNHGTSFMGVAGLKDQIGRVLDAWVDGEKGYAKIKLSGREEVAGIIQDIREGIICNISVGYRVKRFKEQKETFEDLPILRAIDWEPMEVSFVAIPADPDSQSRSEDKKQTREETVIIETKEMGDSMNKELLIKLALERKLRSQEELEGMEVEALQKLIEEDDQARKVAADKEEQERKAKEEADKAAEEKRKAEEAEAQKQKEIEARKNNDKEFYREVTDLCDQFKIDRKDAEQIWLENDNIEGARKEILERLQKKTEQKTFNAFGGGEAMDEKEKRSMRREAAVNGVLHRVFPEKFELKDDQREFAKTSILDLARLVLHYEGHRDVLTMEPTAIAQRALHHTSDFGTILEQITNKSLRQAYEGQPNTYELFTSMRSVSDFKDISSVQLSNGGTLQSVNEKGEYKRTTLEESGEKYKVEKFGLIIGKTWELMVNDDLGAFTRIPARLGVRAREKENEIFWNLLLSNPTMAETGQSLFSSAHGNFVDAGAIFGETNVGAARAGFRTRKDLDGELMPLTAKYLVVPAALETQADKFLRPITPDSTANVNVFANAFQKVVEPRLDAVSTAAWYLASDKSQIAMAEMAKLNGQGPQMFTREGFDVDGMELKIRYVFGMKILDYRGFYKNDGE